MNRLRGTLCVVVVGGVLAGLSGSAAHAGYAGADGAISYSTYPGGEGIYAIEAGKRTIVVKNVPNVSGVDDGVWSPDGHMLAFVRDTFDPRHEGNDTSAIQVLDLRTGKERTVVEGVYQPATWSPDGTKLAYICGEVTICVVDLSGKLLWKAPAVGSWIHDLHWSPTGRMGYISENFKPSRVWSQDADGSNPTPITPDEITADSFAWSPDGSRIAYAGATATTKRLYVGSAEGRDWQTIDAGKVAGLSWSPNGRALIYLGWIDENNHSAGEALVTTNVDGTHRQVLIDPATGTSIYSYDPDWQRLPLLPTNVAAPAVAGTPRVGQVLTATTGRWNGDQPQTYAYRWQRCSASCADVGDTASTYTVTKADAGSQLRVVVTASNGAGTASSTSDRTAAVPEPLFTKVHGRRAGTSVRLTFTVCDQSPATIAVNATDWNLVSGHRRSLRRHTWNLGSGPGCHTALHTWSAPHAGSHVVVIAARDGDGVTTKSLRLTLR